MRALTTFAASALLLGLTTLSATALAVEPPMPSYPSCPIGSKPSEHDAAAAYDFYKAGKRFFDERDLLRAIEQFNESYKRDCTKHDLLVTIARAYELHGDRAQAVYTLKAYLARVPDAPDNDVQRKLIANIERDIADENAKRAAERKVIEEREAEKRRQERASIPVPMHEHTIAPWILVGTGGVLLVGGFILNVATSYPERCSSSEHKCDGNLYGGPDGKTIVGTFTADEKRALEDDAIATQTAKGIGLAGVVVGGAAVIGGLVWHFLEPTGPIEKPADKPAEKAARNGVRFTNVSVAPSVAPGVAGLSFAGRF